MINHPMTKKYTNAFPALAAGVLTTLVLSTSAMGQSADALLDKLVEKGILTVKEANELKEETDKGFTQSYSVKSGMQDWVNSFKLNGDLRLRYDGIYSDNSAFIDRSRMRYRLRFGATAVMKDNFEVGFRLMSGEGTTTAGSDPISGNSTFQDNGSKKLIFVDLAYAKWTPVNAPKWGLAFTGGKMENPFTVSDIVFDPDYTPEGLAQQFNFNFTPDQVVKFNVGEFVLDELSASSNDPYLAGAQLRLESKWNKKIQTSLGIAGFAISGKDSLINANVPNQNRGNTRIGSTGRLAYNFNPIVADAAFTYHLESFPFYAGEFPIRLGGEYVDNLAARSSKQNKAYALGVMLGKSGKRGTWDLSYRYKTLEANSWYEEFVDSDTGAFYQTPLANSGSGQGYGPGTNVRGHHVRASYSPNDAFTFGVTYYLFELINESPARSKSETSRIQIDAILKF